MMKTKINCVLLLLSMTLITYFSFSGVKSLDKLFEDNVLTLAETLPCSMAPGICQGGGCGSEECTIELTSDESIFLHVEHGASQHTEAGSDEWACCWKEKCEQDGIPTFIRPRALNFSKSCCSY